MSEGTTVELVEKGNGEWKARMLFSFQLWQSGAEQFLLLAIDPRQAMRNGFHFDEGGTGLMHLFISTDRSGSTVLYSDQGRR